MPAPFAAIRVRDLEKTFRIPKHQVQTLKERALHPFRRDEYDELHVLRGVSFDDPRRASSSGSSGATAPARARC